MTNSSKNSIIILSMNDIKNSQLADEQFNKMINTPVSKLITKLSIPTIISMLVTSIYNMADTFFVSHINTQASAAVGVVFPIMSIIQAFGFTIGMGSGSLISVKLGQKKNEESSIIISTGIFFAFIFGLIISLLGNIFSSQLLRLVGSSSSVLPYAKDYARFIFLGAPFMSISLVLNNILRSEGKAMFSMIGLTFGGILNIILDPVFIYGFNLGISGAAIATFVSQMISSFILLSWFLRKKTVCRFSLKLISKKFSVIKKIIWTGSPSLARQGMASISTILLNTAAGHYGDEAIAAMSIATKILMFIGSIMIGLGQGFSPVSGYNYGAKQYDRVKQSFNFLFISGFILMSIFSLIIFVFAKQILFFFITDLSVVEIGIVAIRWQVAFMPFHAIIIATNMLMQSTRNIKSSFFLSLNRQGIYFIPAILILPRFLGLLGVEITQFVADVLSSITAIPYLIHFFRKLNKIKNE